MPPCSLGSALLTAVALGFHQDFEQAAAAMIAIEHEVAPNPANHRIYEDLYGVYADLRNAVGSTSASLAGCRGPIYRMDT